MHGYGGGVGEQEKVKKYIYKLEYGCERFRGRGRGSGSTSPSLQYMKAKAALAPDMKRERKKLLLLGIHHS
jgi:hypothetical protein